MAMARPVVATREATRALGVRSGIHLWVANDPQHFADAVLSAFKGNDRQKIAQSGRDYVIQNHSWQAVLANLDTELESVRQAQGRPVSREQTTLRPAV
jgi:glycosyltransferase involved in cell wall biosynthesis